MKSIKFIGILISLICVGTMANGNTDNEHLKYGPEQIQLKGKIVEKTYFGPPGYGENPNSDSKERQLVLQLDHTVIVDGKQSSDLNSVTEKGVSEITLVFAKKIGQKYIGNRVQVEGTLFHSLTGHHHTKILMTVFHISVLGP